MNTSRVMTLADAVGQIKDGEKLVLGHGAVTPNCVVEEIVRQKERFSKLSMFQLIYLGDQVHVQPGMEQYMRVCSPFLSGKDVRNAINEGRADFIPRHFSQVPSLFEKGGTYEPDWAIIQVSAPNTAGEYSCSLSSDFTLPAARKAKKLMAIVNDQLPFVGGDNLLKSEEIDIMIEHSSPAHEVPSAIPSELDKQIAAYCADLVPDRATLQIGIGALPDAVLALLTDRKDLGIHTELLTPGVLNLYKSGAITGKYKSVHVGKMAASFTMGDKALYDFLDGNDEFEQYPVDLMNNPYVIGQNPNMISINSCIEIDLYGQVCSEKIGGKMFSGSGGQFDYVRGIRISEGGKSIIAVNSTAKGGEISRIQPNLSLNNVVTTMRNDIDYVVTEYGVAALAGRTELERAEALVSVAHPKFREELEKSVWEQFPAKRFY